MTISRPLPDKQELRWLAFYQGIETLSNTLDPQQVLENTLEVSAALFPEQEGQAGSPVMAALTYPEDPAQPRALRVGAMRGFSAEDFMVELPGTDGLIGRVLQEKRPQLANQVEIDPELGRYASLSSCEEVFCIPLGKSGLEGVLLYGHPQRGFFSADRRLLLELLAGHASLVLNNARRFREIRLKIEHILDLQEANRVQIARELHDGPTQSVAALAMRVNLARRLAAQEAPSLVEELEKIETIARQATTELRQLQFKIHPQLLESQGLAAALQELGERTSQVHDFTIQVWVEPEIQAGLEMARQMAIFNLTDLALRVICRKEELENIRVHVGAGSQGLTLLEIEDDGKIVSSSVWNPTGETAAWLNSIREQVDLLGGVLENSPSGNHGACLRITFPPGGESAGQLPGEA